jgi:NAD-dependent DNA ligase
MDKRQPQLDEDGQPLCVSWNSRRRIDAGIDELLGFIQGILADGEVSEAETIALAAWTLKHSEIVCDWPVNVLAGRLNRIFADGRVDEAEREDLRTLLVEILGENENPLVTSSTRLPLSMPAPDVIFDQNVFVLTGKFAFGPRRVCEAEVLALGGKTSDHVTLQTSYVVIGSVGSRDWIHSSWGRKIEKAVEYRGLCPIAIISEQHWAEFLAPPPRASAAQGGR